MAFKGRRPKLGGEARSAGLGFGLDGDRPKWEYVERWRKMRAGLEYVGSPRDVCTRFKWAGVLRF